MRPSTRPSASTTCQARSTSDALGENVRTRNPSARRAGHPDLGSSHQGVVTLEDIREARRRVDGVIRRTPVDRSDTLSRLFGRAVLLKPEHLQRTGSFKIRGAYNLISRLEGGEVVAASAGNHAQGVALAAALHDLRATIFMPVNAALPKVEATRGYGAEVRLEGDGVDDSIEAARLYAEQHGATFVPPFDDPLVVAGQGTVGLELANEAPEAGTVVGPVGRGGPSSGVAPALAPPLRHVPGGGVAGRGAGP